MACKSACISLCERKPSRGRANRLRGMAMIRWVVWSCSALIDILITPAQRDEFSGPQCEMLDLLITPIAEAFRRVWTGRSFSPEGRFHSGLEQG